MNIIQRQLYMYWYIVVPCSLGSVFTIIAPQSQYIIVNQFYIKQRYNERYFTISVSGSI